MIRIGLSCLVASIALNACSPATGSISPSASLVSSEASSDLARSRTKRSASSLLFITGSEYSEILDYDQAGKNQYPAGELSINGPVFAMQADKNGNLYVGIYVAPSYELLEYAPGADSPSKTYTGVEDGVDIASCNGTLYVADKEANDVLVYAAGATSPTSKITNSAFASVTSVACDASYNVYVAYQESNDAEVIAKYGPGGTGAGTTLPMPGGYEVRLLKSGNLVISNGLSGISFYKPKSAKPYETIDLAGTFNIDAPEDNLWIAAGFVTYRVVIKTKAVTDEIENPEDAGFAVTDPTAF